MGYVAYYCLSTLRKSLHMCIELSKSIVTIIMMKGPTNTVALGT